MCRVLTGVPAVQICRALRLTHEEICCNILMATNADCVLTRGDCSLDRDHTLDGTLCLVFPASYIFDNVATSEDKVHIVKDLLATLIALVSAEFLTGMITAWLRSLTWLKASHI